MKKVSITLYAFSELNKEAQKKALTENRTINADFGWWQQLEQEANDLQIHINRFDIDKDIPMAIGYVKGSCLETARLIMKKHGGETTLYNLASNFINEQAELGEQITNANDTETAKGLNSVVMVNEKHFVNALLEHYAYMLKAEYYERVTDTFVIRTFEESEMTFEQDGRMNNTKGEEEIFEAYDGEPSRVTWAFVEKYFPNYTSSDKIYRANRMHMILVDEVDPEDKETEQWFIDEYDGSMLKLRVAHDVLLKVIYEAAILEYLKTK